MCLFVDKVKDPYNEPREAHNIQTNVCDINGVIKHTLVQSIVDPSLEEWLYPSNQTKVIYSFKNLYIITN